MLGDYYEYSGSLCDQNNKKGLFREQFSKGSEFVVLLLDSSQYHQLLQLSEEFQTVWLTEQIETHLLGLSSSAIVSLGIKIIVLADKFGLQKLREQLLTKHLSMTILFTEKSDFENLSNATKYAIIQYKLQAAIKKSFGKEELVAIIEVLDSIAAKQPIQERPDIIKKYEKNIVLAGHEKCDIQLRLGNEYTVDAHTWLLCRLSPKLKEMIRGASDVRKDNKKKELEINLFGMKPECIIEMLMHFYPNHKPKITGKKIFFNYQIEEENTKKNKKFIEESRG